MEIIQNYPGDNFGKMRFKAEETINIYYKSFSQSFFRTIHYGDIKADNEMMKSADEGWFKYSVFLVLIAMTTNLINELFSKNFNPIIQIIIIAILILGIISFIMQFQKKTYKYYRNIKTGKLEFGVRMPQGTEFCNFIDKKIEYAKEKQTEYGGGEKEEK
jgi:hypothetical protein